MRKRRFGNHFRLRNLRKAGRGFSSQLDLGNRFAFALAILSEVLGAIVIEAFCVETQIDNVNRVRPVLTSESWNAFWVRPVIAKIVSVWKPASRCEAFDKEMDFWKCQASQSIKSNSPKSPMLTAICRNMLWASYIFLKSARPIFS